MLNLKSLYILSTCFLLLSCSENTIPTIIITKQSEIGWDSKEPCAVRYTSDNESIELAAEIKSRGGSSSKYFKHSYALELEDDFAFDDLPEDDDWILNANYIDKTFMRHKISYDLFRQMSLENKSPKSTFVNLEFNEEYKGLYVLMEEMNASMLGVDRKDPLAMVFKDPPIFHKEKIKPQDPLNYYQQKFPKITKENRTVYIERFRDFLFKTDDKTFTSGINTWVDISNVIDWHILLLLSNNSDGIMKNFFLYKLNTKTPFRFGIWDYDHSFGRDGDNELNLNKKMLNWRRSILLERLMDIEETGYSIKLQKRWKELRDNSIISFENFEKMIDKNNVIIEKEVGRNFEKWPVNEKWYYDDNSYEQELEIMMQYVKMRIPQLDLYFTNLVPID